MWEIFGPRASSLNVEKMEIACLMRDILKALNDFERDFERTHGVCLNEAAVLCSLKSGRLSASDIAAKSDSLRPMRRRLFAASSARDSSSACWASRTAGRCIST